MTNLQIRTGNVDDVPTIVRMNASLFEEDAGWRDPYTNTRRPQKYGNEHFARHISTEKSCCLLAETGNQAIGYLAGYTNE